jgi:carboxynorspermidine decarboxylase
MKSEMDMKTPFYLIDENKLLINLKKIQILKELSGAKSVLALKCFSTWSVFGLMSQYMDGTTSSSLFEARLGKEKFGKEVHAYSVAWSQNDIEDVKDFASKIIFNSISQLNRYYNLVKNLPIGLRINPRVSHSDFDLADPNRRYSRLGIVDTKIDETVLQKINGVMFHCNCDNDNFESFNKILEHISINYSDLLKRLEWVSLGGGIYFTKENYPLEKFAIKLKEFSEKFQVQVYLEPGETAITNSGYLHTSVLDIVTNEIDIAIVDAAVETHMMDLMIYNLKAKMEIPIKGNYSYMVTGKTCLAGDVFGTYSFTNPLQIGDRIVFSDAAGYTMVKKNWFNGIAMPSIVVKRLDGRIDLIKEFHYDDFMHNLS